MKVAEYCVAGIQLGDQKRCVCAHFFFFMDKFCFKKIILFLAMLNPHFCLDFSLVVASRDSCLVAVCGLLIAVASLIEEHRFWVCGLQ